MRSQLLRAIARGSGIFSCEFAPLDPRYCLMKLFLPLLGMMLLTAATKGQAQTLQRADPPELVAKRNEHMAAVNRAKEPLTNNYLRLLGEMKKKYASEGNLEAALAGILCHFLARCDPRRNHLA